MLHKLIDPTALVHNLRLIRQLSPRSEICATVKADAYGHGLARVSKTLADEGVSVWGITTTTDAIFLRKEYPQSRILLYHPAPLDDMDVLIENEVSFFISSLKELYRIQERTHQLGKKARIHLKVDVGMSRWGFRPEKLGEAFEMLKSFPDLLMEGFCSHLPCADQSSGQTQTQKSILLFEQLYQQSLQEGFKPTYVHLANSAALLRFPQAHYNMVRPGLLLYGYPPAKTNTETFKVVMTIQTSIALLKEIPANQSVSYGGTWQSPKAMRLAVLPIGYADGLLRSLSTKGEVCIRQKHYPLVGRICMNSTLVALPLEDPIEEGDLVTILGADLPATRIAQNADTTSYEILCSLGRIKEHL